uniref:ZF(C2H2)-102 zinc finger protein n=1 Tax=Phallusia mammillata TaxID=59560 RepID=A0A6F9DY62_9ASCI|nr:ZF(C2H2)-102 zinc finger protein [Phallusia mammillata]
MARAPREAIVFCVDVGLGMQDAPEGELSSLDYACTIVSMLIQRKIFSQSKDEVALVLFGTEVTANQLASSNDADDDSYSNINVAFPLGIPNFELLAFIAKKELGSTHSVDFLDALTVSLDVLYKNAREKKFSTRRIALFTNFAHNINDDNLDGIINGFQVDGMNVELNIIAPAMLNTYDNNLSGDDGSVDSSDNQPNTSRHQTRNEKRFLRNHHNQLRKPKTTQQQCGEDIIKRCFSSGIEGACYSFQQAMQSVTGFEKRSVNAAAWKCHLQLGNELIIPCTAYAKTKEAKLKQTWKKCHARTNRAEDVTRNPYYHIDDDQRTEVTKEKLAKGYKYGKDIIPFSTDDEKQMNYSTDGKRLSILGFTDMKNVPINLHMDDQAHFVLPEAGNQNAATSISALATGMQNQNLCAIATYIYRKGSNPKLVALIPRIKETYQVFVMAALPFAEDVRQLNFPSLQQTHDLVDQQTLDCLDKFICEMDLNQSEGHDEQFLPSEILNPFFQRTYESLYHRKACPNEPLLDNISHLQLDPHSNSNTDALAEKLKMFFKLEKVNTNDVLSKGKSSWADLDVEKIKSEAESDGHSTSLSQTTLENVVDVGTATPSDDFLHILSFASSTSDVNNAFSKMEKKITELANDPFALQLTDKIIKSLKTFIWQGKEKNQVSQVNTFLKQLKEEIIFSNNRLWKIILENDVNLIEIRDDPQGVTESELQQYRSSQTAMDTKLTEDDEVEDRGDNPEDLLDML